MPCKVKRLSISPSALALRVREILDAAQPPLLERLAAGRSSANFRATFPDGIRILVKCIAKRNSHHTERIAAIARTLDLLYRDLSFEISNCDVLLFKWIDGASVMPEHLTRAQTLSLLAAYSTLSATLQRLPSPPGATEPLIHGDLNFYNILFHGDALAGFVDFEQVRPGLPAEDLLRGFAHRYERTGLLRLSRKRRIVANFERLVSLSSIPRADWLAAIERYRLRKRSIRLAKSRFRILASLDLAFRERLFKRLRFAVHRAFAFSAQPSPSAAQLASSAAPLPFALSSPVPLSVGCAAEVYRASLANGQSVFVKVVPDAGAWKLCQTIAFAASHPHPAVPQVLTTSPARWSAGKLAIVTEWRDGRHVLAEDLSDAEAHSLVAAYKAVFAQPLPSPAPGSAASPYAAIVEEASLYLADCTSWDLPRIHLIHGDLQYRNIAFHPSSPSVAAFFDFDGVRPGHAAEDLVFAITDRWRKSISPSARERLWRVLGIFMASMPFPRETWIKAVNSQRLRVVAKRLAKHPFSPIARLDAIRRDRPLLLLVRRLLQS